MLLFRDTCHKDVSISIGHHFSEECGQNEQLPTTDAGLADENNRGTTEWE